MNKNIIHCALIASLLTTTAALSHTSEGCATYTWNLSREFAAFESKAIAVDTDRPLGMLPALETGKHYRATLHAQSGVSLSAAPGRVRKADHPMAGVLAFHSGKAGRYRIALTSRHWIDVIDEGKTLTSLGHEGRSGCERLLKVVEFDLPADRPLAIQLTGADSATVGLVITGPN